MKDKVIGRRKFSFYKCIIMKKDKDLHHTHPYPSFRIQAILIPSFKDIQRISSQAVTNT